MSSSSNLTARQKASWLQQVAATQGWPTTPSGGRPRKKKGEVEMSTAIDEAVEKYLKKLRERAVLEEQAKEINEKCKDAKNDFAKIGQQINKILRETKSDSILVRDESGEKKVQYILLPNSDGNVVMKEVFTEKEIKTRQAIKKLSKKTKETDDVPF